MQNKGGSIKNPLSVIAIFAGIAEISGTMVLPHIEPANQELFIWFLMSFPFTLVVLFFVTLNWNYKVLYAPSDFKDEEHFVNLQKATTSEILFKMETELDEEDQLKDENKANIKDSTIVKNSPVITDVELKLSEGDISTKEERLQHSKIMKEINRQRMRELRLLEDLLINKLQVELGQDIERDMKFQNGNNRFMFDGVIRKGNNITAIEARRMNKNSMSHSNRTHLISRFKGFYQSLSESEKKEFSLIFAIATDDEIADMESFLSVLLADLGFNVDIRVYPVEELANEQLQKAS